MHDNDQIITGSSYSYSKTSMNKKPFIIGGIVIFALAGLAVLFFLVILPKIKQQSEPDGDEVVEIVVQPEDVTEYDSADDYLAELEQQAVNAETADQRLTARLNIVSFLVALEQYSDAEAKMAEISTEGFDTDDFYRYYNVYSRIYDEGRDVEKYNEYRKLTTEYLNKLQDENFDQIMDAASANTEE